MTNLSPAAQAVVAAIEKFDWESGHFSREEIWFCSREVVAAALCAAADQVVPWRPEPTESSVGPTIDYGYAWALFSKANDIRQELIAIADELEAQ
jgi:hypothetical protein